ncbi:Hypothetical protein PHPALM_4464 [Phytophthora palmivora]|uniref:Uncharacterized protein n=1 Tax=Phytophthora palmivora TaxID=4796 RepID=A0A2P4YJR5_9STRA|nr:Hypothetical protein PHPALM_4464 [Phytophthora palmivora]
MVKGTSTLREDSPAGYGDSADSNIAMTMDATAGGSRSVQFDEEDAQGHASDEEKEDEEDEEKAELSYVKTTAELLGEAGELSLQVGRMGVPRPVERNLAAELGEDADDEDQGVAQRERLSLVPRATRNADTPSANKVLAQLGGEMMRNSEWMKLFDPLPLAQMVVPNSVAQGINSAEWSLNLAKNRTPETKKGERFRATAETLYFEDSHMLSPKKSRTRLGRNMWESEEDNSAEAGDDSDDEHGYRLSREETVKDQIYHLSNDRGDQGGSQYLELRSHFDQWVRSRYYPAKRKDKEMICDFLTRLNGYARTAKIQYERGGADAADHVERFLLNCDDDDIMDMLCPLQLNDVHRVTQIINKKIQGEKRKKQRCRLV